MRITAGLRLQAYPPIFTNLTPKASGSLRPVVARIKRFLILKNNTAIRLSVAKMLVVLGYVANTKEKKRMMIEIDFSSDEAIYQLTNQIIMRIATSRLQEEIHCHQCDSLQIQLG